MGELLKELSEEPRFLYPETDEGRAQVLEDYRKIIAEISTGLDDWFSVQPKAGVEVERIPAFKEKTSPRAYYNAPAMDGSRPGIFYANLYDLKATPKYDIRTLTSMRQYQAQFSDCDCARTWKELPRHSTDGTVHRVCRRLNTLYGACSPGRQGSENDHFDNIGRLRAGFFRAVRLVVDTGLHAKRWTREEGYRLYVQDDGQC